MHTKTSSKSEKDTCKRKNTKDSTCVKKLKTSKTLPPLNKEDVSEQRKQKLKDLARKNSSHVETHKSPKAQTKVKVM